MALYVLQGSVSLMAQHLKEGHDKLPLVLPICIYHGKISPYPNSADIFDHFEDPDLARALVFKPFSLVDLTTMTEEAIKQREEFAGGIETVHRRCSLAADSLPYHGALFRGRARIFMQHREPKSVCR